MKNLMILLMFLLVAMTPYAIEIANEDFEAGAVGWNNNTTEYSAGFSHILGRFGGTGGAQAVYKTFALSGNQSDVTVQFDFCRIDSWDGESFYFYINDILVIQDSFGGGGSHLGFHGSFTDAIFSYTINSSNTTSSIKIGFGSSLDQSIPDESWGIDNLVISTNGNPVPEPATYLLVLLTGLIYIYKK